MRQPDIIGVQESDILPLSVANAQIARSALATILMARVLEVAHPLRVLCGILPGNSGTLVSGAVVDQQQFPTIIALLEDAFDCLLDKSLRAPDRKSTRL